MDSARLKLEEFQISEVYEISKKGEKKSKRNKPSKKTKVKIVNMDSENLEIDFIGYHTSLVNAFRRIILAEVPTMAIEKVYMYNNTSVVQDEVLAHRLGLVPLRVDPRFFEFRSQDDTEWGPQDSVKFELKVKFYPKEKPNFQRGGRQETSEELSRTGKNVLTSSLKWLPIGNQSDIFPDDSMAPLHDDILLAKLNPGHLIQLEAYGVKGIGSDHAKFQPGLAWYRLLPEVELLRDVEGDDALLLQKCFSKGVIDLKKRDGRNYAQVNDARYDSCSRNVFEYDSLKDSVKLTRKTDHIIFHVESHSFLKSHEILEESVKIMISKCNTLLVELNKFHDQDDD